MSPMRHLVCVAGSAICLGSPALAQLSKEPARRDGDAIGEVGDCGKARAAAFRGNPPTGLEQGGLTTAGAGGMMGAGGPWWMVSVALGGSLLLAFVFSGKKGR